MSNFGGLFGHDKLSARASGKFSDNGELPALPGQFPAFSQASALPQAPPVSSAMDVSAFAPQQFSQMPRLPQAPPPRGGAFDADHRSQTMLQMAAGFFGSQNFGDGMANAARAIHSGNEAAWNEGKPVIGGPDDAFEIRTDPRTGERTYTPIKAVVDYQAEQAARMADLKTRRPAPSAKDNMDAFGRLSSVVAGYPPEQQSQAWDEGKRYLASMGIEGLPDAYNPAYREYGAPVPVMARAETGQLNADEKKRHNVVMEGFTGAKVDQGATRVNLAVTAAKNRGPQRGGGPRVTTQAQYQALRPGTPYIAPDGTHRIKK